MAHNSERHRVLWQVAAVAGGLFPIGLLFGIVAQQSHWTWAEVLLLSVFGFSASGQFFYVKLASEHINLVSAFFVILMLNIRYVPMSLAAWSIADNGRRGLRVVLAHFVSDESFAIEPKTGRPSLRTGIRMAIYGIWVASSALGAIAGKHIPSSWLEPVAPYLLFPATAILAILAIKRLDQALLQNMQFRTSLKLALLLESALFSGGVMYLIGVDFFWIPGILGVTGILYVSGWGSENERGS